MKKQYCCSGIRCRQIESSDLLTTSDPAGSQKTVNINTGSYVNPSNSLSKGNDWFSDDFSEEE